MGYQRRMGFELIAKIIKTIRPTDIIQIQHSIKGFNFQEIITEELVKSFKFVLFNDMFEQSYFTTHVMDSVVNRTLDTTWNSNASYKRKLILLCHLANLLNTSCTYLNDVVPFW